MLALVFWLSGPAAEAAIHPVSGNHRLFDRFVEDGAVVPRGWVELVAGYADYRQGDRDRVAGTVVAFRFGRNVEAGLLGGALDRRRSAGAPLFGAPLPEEIDGAGLADAALYGKYRALSGPFDLAVGGRVTIPLGDDQAGRGPGVFQYEAFTGVRKTWPRATVVGSAGVAGRDDSQAPGAADGRISLKLGVGTLIPLSLLWTMMAEVAYESARFAGEGSDAEIVVGFDWRPTKFLAARCGAGAGVTDEAADFTAVISVVMFF
ncbi:MAG TPA: hypothetical protein VFG08_07775 [Candidatus Polarisedimenticolia bacterium]|nr:hypothetical protein [Candidatus Polarisedimenticolia bacterium]